VSNSYNFSPEDDEKVTRDYAYIPAPAFFAESLLFLSEPVPAPYSAKCLTRAEFATFSLEDVEAVLSALPYLRERFDDFSKKVNARRQTAGSGVPVPAASAPKSTLAAPTDLPRTSPSSPISRRVSPTGSFRAPYNDDGEVEPKRPASKKKAKAKNVAKVAAKPVQSPPPKAKKAKAVEGPPENPQ
jgi:hypothetical protein